MLRVQLNSANSATAQAAGRGPHTIIITESRAGEADEPRHLIRRAIWAIKANRTANLRARKRSDIALKAIGLMYAASLRAKALGGWSACQAYDPLPDMHELRSLAARRLGRGSGEDDPVRHFRDGIQDAICMLSESSPARRIGA